MVNGINGLGESDSDLSSGTLFGSLWQHVPANSGTHAAMFVKLTRSGSRRYVQLVESYRDESGKPRQRTIATVGRLDATNGAVQS